MTSDRTTLIKLLRTFQEELKTCMDHKDPMSTADGSIMHVSTPILLGDFVVDTYNTYLDQAKACCDDTIVHALPPIEKANQENEINVSEEPELKGDARIQSQLAGMSRHPQLQKMSEVAMSTKQLLTCLEQSLKTDISSNYSGMVGVMSLLEGLEEQLDNLQEDIANAKQSRRAVDNEEWLEAVLPLIETYNQYLSLCTEQIDDPILQQLFKPLGSDTTQSYSYHLSRVRTAQNGLMNYLKKIQARIEG